MSTEDVSPRYLDLDLWGSAEALEALFEGQLAAVAAVRGALPAIAAAVEEALPRLRRGGRLVYAGAGTSGRLAVQDGAELTPTFNWPRERLAFAIAGGKAALMQAIENAEDSREAAGARIAEIGVGAEDVAIGVAASGATPYTVAAIEAAGGTGALTIGIANTPGAPLLKASKHAILIETGAEAIAGSTRMKAGTAQKVALNLMSTLIMVRLGKVYRGQMVHMRPTNEKLRRRAERMVMRITGADQQASAAAIAQAKGDIKLAVLVVRGLDSDAAAALLDKHEGDLRRALAEAPPQD